MLLSATGLLLLYSSIFDFYPIKEVFHWFIFHLTDTQSKSFSVHQLGKSSWGWSDSSEVGVEFSDAFGSGSPTLLASSPSVKMSKLSMSSFVISTNSSFWLRPFPLTKKSLT